MKSKLEQLKEKENKIKILQNRVEELQKVEMEKRETSLLVVNMSFLLELLRLSFAFLEVS